MIVYGVEVWGWKEIGDFERIYKKYIKWTLGLDTVLYNIGGSEQDENESNGAKRAM